MRTWSGITGTLLPLHQMDRGRPDLPVVVASWVRRHAPGMGDLYAILGVTATAEPTVIRDAYRALARRCHPDHGGDQDEMARLNEAWSVLGKSDRRAAYDAGLAQLETDRACPLAAPRRRRDGHTVIDFGRYAGWTLVQIAAEDDDYLAWLARTPIGRPLRGEIAAILDERAQAMHALRPVTPSARDRLGRRRDRALPRRRRWAW